jgi:hypothetical protein
LFALLPESENRVVTRYPDPENPERFCKKSCRNCIDLENETAIVDGWRNSLPVRGHRDFISRHPAFGTYGKTDHGMSRLLSVTAINIDAKSAAISSNPAMG